MMYSNLRRHLRGDSGASVITFLLLVPILIMFAELIVVGGRLTAVQADVNAAARQTARQASLAASAQSAEERLEASSDLLFSEAGRECVRRDVALGPQTNFVAGGLVEVSVSCTVSLADIGLLRVPGERQIVGRSFEPIDRYREVE